MTFKRQCLSLTRARASRDPRLFHEWVKGLPGAWRKSGRLGGPTAQPRIRIFCARGMIGPEKGDEP